MVMVMDHDEWMHVHTSDIQLFDLLLRPRMRLSLWNTFYLFDKTKLNWESEHFDTEIDTVQDGRIKINLASRGLLDPGVRVIDFDLDLLPQMSENLRFS